MKDHYEELRAENCEVIAFSFAPPEIVGQFLQESPMPFAVLSDPSRSAYHALGLGRTSWGAMLRPASVGRYLKLMFRGWRPGKPRKDEDLLQLGGDFILDAEGRVTYAHRSAEPTDRPGVEELLRELRGTAHQPGQA